MEFLKSGYLTQTDNNSCGPIATINAEIWKALVSTKTVIGTEPNKTEPNKPTGTGWETLGPRRYLLRTKHNNYPVRGTLWEDMDRVLRQLGVSHTMTTNLEYMRKALNKGQSLIVMYSYSDQKVIPGCRIEAHYIFVYPDLVTGRIYVVNEDRKYFNTWETFEQTYLSNNPSDAEGNNYPRCWVVGSE